MSIPQELGEGIEQTRLLMEMLNNRNSPPAVPILLCLDVDHGDRGSNNPDDTDPYEWIRLFGKQSPTVDLKEVIKNLFGHKPFTLEYNKVGLINPEELIKKDLISSGYFVGIDWYSTDHSGFTEGTAQEDEFSLNFDEKNSLFDPPRMHFSNKEHIIDLFRDFDIIHLEHNLLETFASKFSRPNRLASWNFIAKLN